MLELSGYKIIEKIYEDCLTVVYRGQRLHDHCPVVLKGLHHHSSDTKKLAQLHHEYEITRELDLQGIVKPYGFQKYNNRWVLIFEDIQGEPLRKILTKCTLDLVTFLKIAIQLAHNLGELHQHNIIHKDIKPDNIIINLQTGQVKITDFSIASRLVFENQTVSNPNLFEGTLLYMSPEQTGRMNRILDYRTDFYSLGVVFYEMLVGHPPFQTTDPLELVHSHIAKLPIPPHALNADIPEVISHLVMKLLAKMAEARYQSAYGLKADLEACLQQLQAVGKINEFTCGQYDIVDKFQIPQKLYGREQEIPTYLETFERISQGAREMILIAGYSGIGKSSLVKEIYKPLTKKRGYFISGKFDQFQRNIPHSAFVFALNDLIQQLLTENESQLRHWREKLQVALGPNGQVMVDVIPELELIIGAQPRVETLDPTAAQNRFNQVFTRFIRVFCQPEHPLVIFLDDLQWADSATLKLIELVMTDETLRYLCLIGAYRDNEVQNTHPLLLTFNVIKKTNIGIQQITLKPLCLEHLTEMISETLHSAPEKVESLAQLVMRKTEGNPFFVIQFLKTLYEEELLTFEPQPADFENRGGWQWDVNHIEAMDITDNVVDLMIAKLRKLPTVTQQVLRLSACIGNYFDLRTLAIVHKKTAVETFNDLLPALQEGLVLSTTAPEVTKDVLLDVRLLIVNYKFLHDRVQQAAYALIDENKKKSVHLMIGRLLLADVLLNKEQASDNTAYFDVSASPTSPINYFWENETTLSREMEEKLFDIVNHFNIARNLIVNLPEKLTLAHLNLAAGKKAKNATAYIAARTYLNIGIQLLEPLSPWENHYTLAYALHREQIDVEYLNGHFEQSEALINLTLEKANTNLEKIDIYNTLIIQYTMMAKYDAASHIGREALRLLDIDLPQQELNAALSAEMALVKTNLGHRSVKSLIDAPPMVLPEQKAAMRLLSNLIGTTFFSNPLLLFIVITKSVNLSLLYGHCEETPIGYGSYGMVTGSILGEYQTAYEFGTLALKLSEQYSGLSQKCKAWELFANMSLIWVKHLKAADDLSDKAYRIGLEVGELQFAGYILVHKLTHAFYAGDTLEHILTQDIPKSLSFVEKTRNQLAIDSLKGYQLGISALIASHNDQFSESENELQDSNYLSDCRAHGNLAPICRYLLVKCQIWYLYGEYNKAFSYIQKTDKILSSLVTLLPVAEHNFYTSLVLLALYPSVDEKTQTVYWDRIRKNQRQMKLWADNCEANFLHKYLLIEAEIAHLKQDVATAMRSYDHAVASAQEYGFIQNAALANELAGRFWLSIEKQEFALSYLQKALTQYTQWGATRKVEKMKEEFPLLRHSSHRTYWLGNDNLPFSTFSAQNPQLLDLESIIKASQAISKEIVLEQLIRRMMQIVIENGGADRGFLILEKEGEFYLVAQIEAESKETIVFSDLSLDSIHPQTGIWLVPASLIRYVARTQEALVLNNILHEGLFVNDAYITWQRPKSVLCIPMIYQSKLVGLLYLENNLITNAFTVDRLTILRLLGSQIAISIQNSLLYKRHEEARYLAESANCAKSAFLANMSHELRTPLNAILGYTQILERYKHLDPKLQEGLSVIQRSGEYLLTLINDVLDLSKIEAGRAELYPTHFLFREFLKEITELFRIRAEQKGITFIYEPLSQLPRGIFADEKRLRQILINLLGNAIKFTEHGGVIFKVGYETAPSFFSTVPENEGKPRLRFHVEDTGIGIAHHQLEKIFLPFHQASDWKHKSQGTGLGLSITKTLVEMMKGEIHVQSELGRGSIFWVLLDLPEAHNLLKSVENKGQDLPIIIGFEGNSRKILVVDDRWENRAVLVNLLTPLGFSISEATNGQESVQKALQIQPDLIITDLVMPVMDGFEATRRMRQIEGLKHVPIIAASASILDEQQNESLTAGCNAFLTKPFRSEVLFSLLQQYLNLTWIYEKREHTADRLPALAPSDSDLSEENLPFAELPLEHANTLFDLAMRGDIFGIINYTEKLKQLDANLLPFATHVGQLARNFKEEEICRLLERYTEKLV